LAQIIISNKSNVPRAEILAIVSDDHQLTKNESMQAWIASGETFESWSRLTSILKVTDKAVDELIYLLEPFIDGEGVEMINDRKWYFAEPSSDSIYYQSLYSTGEVTALFNDVLPYIRCRT